MKLIEGSAYIIFKDINTGEEKRRWDLFKMSYYSLTSEQINCYYNMALNEKAVRDKKLYITLIVNAFNKEDKIK